MDLMYTNITRTSIEPTIYCFRQKFAAVDVLSSKYVPWPSPNSMLSRYWNKVKNLVPNNILNVPQLSRQSTVFGL